MRQVPTCRAPPARRSITDRDLTANDLSAVGAIDVIERGGLVVPTICGRRVRQHVARRAESIGLTTSTTTPRNGCGGGNVLIDAINDRVIVGCGDVASLVVRRTTSVAKR